MTPLERLPQGFEDTASELGEFVEQQDSAVRQAGFTERGSLFLRRLKILSAVLSVVAALNWTGAPYLLTGITGPGTVRGWFSESRQ